MIKLLMMTSLLLLLLSGCDEKKEPPKTVGSGMKCGAGKCGANMFDGNSALDKKKKNILSQMRDDDSRKDCVIAALSTKEAYDCVRDKETQKMTLKCGSHVLSKEPAMKCGAGKCGSKTPKKEPVMKCAAGKCA